MARPHGEDVVIPYDEDVPISREFCRSTIPSFFAVAAYFLSWIGTLGCEFIKFEILPTNYNNNTTTEDPITVHFGIWYRQSVESYPDSGGEGGREYYIVSTCTSYGDNININPSWIAARAFSTLVLILGGIALLLELVTCCCANQKYASNVDLLNGGIYLVVTLFQGLTLIILSSKLCQNNDYIRQMMGQENGCNLSEGAKCIIYATVFWFLAGVFSCNSFRAERKKMEAKKKSLVIADASPSTEPLLPQRTMLCV